MPAKARAAKSNAAIAVIGIDIGKNPACSHRAWFGAASMSALARSQGGVYGSVPLTTCQGKPCQHLLADAARRADVPGQMEFKKDIIMMKRALLAAGAVHAHDHKLGNIAIGHPWARPTAEGAKTGAVYLSLENSGGEADTLVSADSPVAGKTQIHETTSDGGVMKMRQVEGGVALATEAALAFKPGGYRHC